MTALLCKRFAVVSPGSPNFVGLSPEHQARLASDELPSPCAGPLPKTGSWRLQLLHRAQTFFYTPTMTTCLLE